MNCPSTGARLPLLAFIGPGLMLAATGVGAGDLAGGAFAGMNLGIAVLWAVVLGAFFKYVITEKTTSYIKTNRCKSIFADF